MDAATAYALTKTRIETQWAALVTPAVPLIFTNEQRPTFEEAPNCVHVEIRFGNSQTVGFGGIGNNLQRQFGEVIFRVFGPADQKMPPIIALADIASGILRYWSANSGGTTLRFFDCGPAGGGEDDKDGVFYELDAIASFYFDTIG